MQKVTEKRNIQPALDIREVTKNTRTAPVALLG